MFVDGCFLIFVVFFVLIKGWDVFKIEFFDFRCWYYFVFFEFWLVGFFECEY